MSMLESPPQLSFSIVTVTRNDLAGLKATIGSVQAQTLQVQQIVVDGASNDGTRDWLQSLHVTNHFKWTSEPDHGIYDAMNKGAACATGHLLMFINSGDVLHSRDTLERILSLYKHTPFEWGAGISRMMDENGRPSHLHMNLPFKPWLFRLGLKTLPHQATIIERSLFRRLGGYDRSIGLHADQELLYRALKGGAQPANLYEIIADCDARGISSRQEVGAFADQMASIRQIHGDKIGRFQLTDALCRHAATWALRLRARL